MIRNPCNTPSSLTEMNAGQRSGAACKTSGNAQASENSDMSGSASISGDGMKCSQALPNRDFDSDWIVGGVESDVGRLSLRDSHKDSHRDSNIPEATCKSKRKRSSKAHKRKHKSKGSRHREAELAHLSKLKRDKAAAQTAALYYGECYLEGVCGNAADAAAKESHANYKKWWLQEFNTHDEESTTSNNSFLAASFGDAYVLPRFNKFNTHRKPLQAPHPSISKNIPPASKPYNDNTIPASTKNHLSAMDSTNHVDTAQKHSPSTSMPLHRAEDGEPYGGPARSAIVAIEKSRYYSVDDKEYSNMQPLTSTGQCAFTTHPVKQNRGSKDDTLKLERHLHGGILSIQQRKGNDSLLSRDSKNLFDDRSTRSHNPSPYDRIEKQQNEQILVDSPSQPQPHNTLMRTKPLKPIAIKLLPSGPPNPAQQHMPHSSAKTPATNAATPNFGHHVTPDPPYFGNIHLQNNALNTASHLKSNNPNNKKDAYRHHDNDIDCGDNDDEDEDDNTQRTTKRARSLQTKKTCIRGFLQSSENQEKASSKNEMDISKPQYQNDFLVLSPGIPKENGDDLLSHRSSSVASDDTIPTSNRKIEALRLKSVCPENPEEITVANSKVFHTNRNECIQVTKSGAIIVSESGTDDEISPPDAKGSSNRKSSQNAFTTSFPYIPKFTHFQTQQNQSSTPNMAMMDHSKNSSHRKEKTFSQDGNKHTVSHQSSPPLHYHNPASSYTTSASAKEASLKNPHLYSSPHDFILKHPSDEHDAILTSVASPSVRSAKHVENAKTSLLHALAVSGGDVTTQPFLHALEQLRTLYHMSGWDAREPFHVNNGAPSKTIEGMWLTLSRQNFRECLGKNTTGEYMYTLGRMSFDMFRPSNLVCSIQAVFNPVELVDVKDRNALKGVPRGLKDDLHSGGTTLRTYNIVTAFTIEPDSPQFGSRSPNHCIHRPIRGIMTTFGYVLPDPETPNRLSIWFSGGTMEVNEDDVGVTEWKRVFGGVLPRRQLQEKARILAAKLLLGATVPEKMEEDGSMSYHMSRPIGGHGTAYVDILYLDDTLRIVQGHRGSLYVFARVPSKNGEE